MRFKHSLCSLLGAMAMLWSAAPGAQAQQAPTNGQLLDRLLATAKPGDKYVRMGDVFLPVEELRRYRGQIGSGRQAASAFFRIPTWPGGHVPYVFDASLGAAERTKFTQAARELETMAKLSFTPRVNEPNYLRVFTDPTAPTGVSYAQPAGYAGNGEQKLSLNTQSNKYTAVHEIMHVLGLMHEQSRSDRDGFVIINFDNIATADQSQFAIVNDSNNRGTYDFDSVMHYGQNFFAIDPTKPTITVKAPNQRFQNTIGQSDHISVLDAKGLADIYGPLGPIVRPSNDLFANGQVLAGSAGSVDGTNTLATIEAGEPNSATSAATASVWYRWHPANNGTVTFTTLGSDIDTNLAVFVGPSLQTLTAVTANDDAVASTSNPTPGLTSSVTFPAQANATYYISVDGAANLPLTLFSSPPLNNKSGDTGKFKLNWNQDVNASRSTLRGNVKLNTGRGLSGVVINLSGADANNQTTSGTATTNSAGDFSIAGLLAGTYNLRAVKAGYTFSPNPLRVKVSGASTGNNITATAIPESLLPGLSVSDVSIREGKSGDSVVTFNVTMNMPSKDTVTVSYGTLNGTALSGSDYNATSGSLSFAPGVTTLTVSVRVRPDSVVESDETFSLKISNPVGAKIVDEIGVATLVNDDIAAG